jgi:hypothetical protein
MIQMKQKKFEVIQLTMRADTSPSLLTQHWGKSYCYFFAYMAQCWVSIDGLVSARIVSCITSICIIWLSLYLSESFRNRSCIDCIDLHRGKSVGCACVRYKFIWANLEFFINRLITWTGPTSANFTFSIFLL